MTYKYHRLGGLPWTMLITVLSALVVTYASVCPRETSAGIAIPIPLFWYTAQHCAVLKCWVLLPDFPRPNTAWLHSHEVPRVGKLIEIERTVVAGDWWERGMGVVQRVQSFTFTRQKKFWKLVYSSMIILSNTKLYTLKWLNGKFTLYVFSHS